MQRLAGVLLEMQPLDADRDARAIRQFDDHLALADDRRLVLADLIALRQIGIEIVLPVEHRAQIDLRVQPEPGAHRLPHAFLVDHRQHARHRGIDQRDVAVRLAAEFGRGARKQLRVRGDLGMDFQPDHHFPVAGCALDQRCGCRTHALFTPEQRGQRSAPIRSRANRFATGLAGLAVPIAGIAEIAFDAVQIGMHPGGLALGLVLHDLVRLVPVALGGPPRAPQAARPGSAPAPRRTRLALNSAMFTTTSPA